MIRLHALWVPEDEAADAALFLWGEAPREDPETRDEPTGRRLPFVASAREVRSRLGRVGDGLLYECAEAASETLLWPSDADGPIPSSDVRPGRGDAPQFSPWRVEGLRIPPGDTLAFLAGLPAGEPEGVSYGGSLRFWSEAAAFALGLLTRQRIAPTALTIEGRTGRLHRAVWRPVLSEHEDRAGLDLLVQAVPGLCRTRCPHDGYGATGNPSPSEYLVRDFLGTILDETVRRVLAEDGFPDGGSRRNASRSIGGPIGNWLRALGWIDGRMDGEPAVLEDFTREIRRWSEALAEPPPGSYRTAFRVAEPPGAREAEASDHAAVPWRLEFYLQDRQDPEILVPAERVWEERDLELTWGNRTFRRPHERLLEDLGRASRIFPPLEKALETSLPTGCDLELAEAYAFLRQGGPILEESGFGVLLPEWWQDSSRRPRLRIRLRPAEHRGAPGTPTPETGRTTPSAEDRLPAAPLGESSPGPGLIHYDWEVALGETRLSPDDFRRLAAEKAPLIRIRESWIALEPEVVSSIETLLDERPGDQTLSLMDAIRLGSGASDPRFGLAAPEVEAEGWVASFLDRARGTVAPEPVRMDGRFHGQLRPYQERGVGWLEFMRHHKLGACLADDMGLGKTVQLIGLLLHERASPESRTEGPEGDAAAGNRISSTGPTLVLCPMSVVGNWQREIERFGPGLRVLVHHGLRRARDESFVRRALDHDVVISTYALAHRDRFQLRRVPWERVVLDEAQNIKNPTTLQARAVRSLPAVTRVALTGTPLENRLLELWSILDTLNPGYLQSRGEFHRTFAVPIERYRDARRRRTLRKLVQPFLLRRLKTDPEVIRDLPEKLEMRVYCNLTREQAALYQAVVSEMLAAIDTSRGIARRGLILATLTRLKQICNHPVHYLQDGSSLEGRSGKVARLAEMLEEILAVGDRALVFTQFTEMGALIRAHLSERFRAEIPFLHGGTPKAARDRMVDAFQSERGPAIFLLSLRAGGTGLNLTAANHVFHFDRWWNPAVEDQATDRAYRIGQTRNVQVHKFVCIGTLEEKIDQMLLEKRDLATAVVGAGEQWLTELDTDQLREILTLSRDAVSEDWS